MRAPTLKQPAEFAGPDSSSTKVSYPDAYKEVLACLGKFTQQVTENTALTFQREKASKSYQQKIENYEKTVGHHSNYPPISEQQRKGRDHAKVNLEKMDQILAQKQLEMARSMESLAARIVSGGVDTSAINKNLQRSQDQLNDLEKRFSLASEESIRTKEAMSAMNRDLHHECGSLKQQISSLQNELVASKAATGDDQANKMQLEYLKNATLNLSNLSSRLDGEVVKVRDEMLNASRSLQQDIGSLRQNVGLATQEIKSVKEDSKLMDQEIKANSSKWDQDHKLLITQEASCKTLLESQQQNSQTFVDLRMRITKLEDKTVKLDPKRLTEDNAGFRRRIEALESRPARIQASNSSTGRSSSSTGNATEEYAVKVDELFSSVETMRTDLEQLQTSISTRLDQFTTDNDDIYGNGMDALEKQVSSLSTGLEAVVGRASALETHLQALRERHNVNIQGLATSQGQQGVGLREVQSEQAQQAATLQVLQRDVNALKAAPRPAELPSNYPQNTTGFPRQTSSPVVSNMPALGRQSGSPVVNNADVGQPNLRQVMDTMNGLHDGFRQLNTRFNSLTTDALARQMWSQLDNVHPHLKDATKGLAKMEHTIQILEGQLPRLHQRIDSLEQRNLSPGYPPGLKEALEKVDQNVTALGNRTDNTENTARSLQTQIDKVREDVNTKNDSNVTLKKSNGTLRGDRSSSDSGLTKRKAIDTTNGNSKRMKHSARRIINDSEDEIEDQSNGHSDALSPNSK